MEYQMLAGEACSLRCQTHSMLSEEGVSDFLFPIGLVGPLKPAHFPLVLLRALCSKKLIL